MIGLMPMRRMRTMQTSPFIGDRWAGWRRGWPESSDSRRSRLMGVPKGVRSSSLIQMVECLRELLGTAMRGDG